MSNYSKATNFAAKDSLAHGNPAKIVKGTELDNEFNAIAGAISSKVESSDITAALTGISGRIVQSVTTVGGSGATTSGSWTATSASATITPTSASSKILVIISGMFWQTNGYGGNAYLTIYKNGVNVNSGSPMAMGSVPTGSNSFYGSTAISFLDSPASTSALTYTPYIFADSGGTANWGAYNSSRITLLEIL
jgi:hypothetical protein